jgi:hypothetical protein
MLPDQWLFNTLVSLLVLAYPIDTAKLWFATSGPRQSFLFFALATLIFIISYKSRRFFLLFLSCIFLALSFLSYELFSTLTLGIIGMLWLFDRSKTKQLLIWTFSWLITLAGYLSWRVILFPKLHAYLDPKVSLWVFDFSHIIKQTFQSFIRAFYSTLRYQIFSDMFRRAPDALMWGIVIISTAFFLAFFVWFQRHRQRNEGQGWKFWLGVMAVGFLLILLGYMSIIPTSYYITNSFGMMSRNNYAAIPGISVVFVSLFMIFSEMDKKWARWGAHIGFSMLMGLSIGRFYSAQHSYATAWELQKQMLSQLYELAPRLKPDTVVALGISSEHLYIGDTQVFSNSWELTPALQLLYDDPTLSGSVLVGEVVYDQQFQFKEDHFTLNLEAHPYQDLLILEWDGSNLQFVETIPNYFSGKVPSGIRSNQDNILPAGKLSNFARRVILAQ